MISTERFTVNESRMELINSTPGALQCSCTYADLENYVENCVPWHWHQRFEISYLKSGRPIKRIGENAYTMNPGEAIFINSNVLHAVDPSDKADLPKYYSISFDADFLTGGFHTLYSQKYVLPLSTSAGLRSYLIRSDSPQGIRMLACLMNLIELFDQEPFGYEFRIRSILSDFWILLYEATSRIRENSSRTNPSQDSKVRTMIEYIEQNYADKIMLPDIAEAAGISTRECTRCFSKVIGQSPVDYLNHYRIRQAAGMLVGTDSPISLISENCGFLSDSYFGKMFRDIMGCSPREYRRGKPAL